MMRHHLGALVWEGGSAGGRLFRASCKNLALWRWLGRKATGEPPAREPQAW